MNIIIILILTLAVGIFPAYAEPFIQDQNYIVHDYVSGLSFPTAMTFVGEDILVIEKNTGNVMLVRNGTLIQEPVLHVDVNSKNERGLLGLTSIGSEIYLYYTASEGHQGEAIENQIHNYQWDGQSLVNDVLIRQIPTDPQDNSMHNGGAMTVDNEGMVYATVGDARMEGILQNYENDELEDTGIIIKVNNDISVLKPSQTENPQDFYLAIGIRNSFGITVDPITGFVWDTENGPRNFDEINLVEPKFNSGWAKIMGPASPEDIKNLPSYYDFKYSDPEFSWEHTVAPTGITFVTSELFEPYQDSVFVGDFNSGSLYKFTLNQDRTGFEFQDPSLEDLVLNFDDSDFEISLGKGFLGIVDLEFGPDGFLYVLTIGDGKIHKVVPSSNQKTTEKIEIPIWTKKIFSWWNNERIDDKTLLTSLEYLVNKNIIVLKNLPENSLRSNNLPMNFEEFSIRWTDGTIETEDFGIFLIELANNNVISVDKKLVKCNSEPKFMSDFSDCDFSNLYLSNLDISYSNMNNLLLTSATIKNTDLSLSNFSHSDLTNAVFDSVDLRGGDLSHSSLINTKIINSDLSGSDFRNVNSVNTILTNSTMHDINFENANLAGADFSNSSLLRARFNYADLSQSNFSDSKLHKALFSDVNLQNAQMKSSDLRAIRGSNSNFEGANFENADLKNAYLDGSNLKNANFYGADLKAAILTNTNLEGANFENSNLDGVSFKNANLTGANLRGANLSNVGLLKTIIDDVDFTGAITDGCVGCP